MDSTQCGKWSIRAAGAWLPVWLSLCLGAGPAVGQQAAPPATPAAPPAVKIPGQELEDPIESLQPAEPRTAADAARVDALGWFATGRIFLGRGDLPAAYRSFQRAVEKDDGILAVYRQLIPLALQLNQADQAVKWVQRASELAPDDFEWLVQLAELQIRSENVGGAIQSLERATTLKTLDPKSTPYVVLKHQLGQWYLALQRFPDAARVLEPVYEAIVDPAQYKLTSQVRTQILSGLSLEKFGEVFLEGNRPDLALAALTRATEKRTTPSGDLQFLLARAHARNNQPEQALGELEKYLQGKRQSRRQAPYELLAEVLTAQNRTAEVIPRLEKAVQDDPRNPFLQVALAERYLAADRLAEAEAQFKKTLAVAPDARGYAGLAGVYRRQKKVGDLLGALAESYGESGSLKQIERELQALLSDKPLAVEVVKEGRTLFQAEGARKKKWNLGQVLAHLASEARETDAAVEFYRQLLVLAEPARRDDLYEEYGAMLIEAHRYIDAADLYRQAAGAANDERQQMRFASSEAYALALAGQFERAKNQIQQLISRRDGDPSLLFREAWIYAHARQFDEAINRYEKLIQLFGSNPQVVRLGRSGLSNAYVSKGDLRRGEQILEESYRESPDDISLNNDLGYLYADQGKNLEQAEKMIRKALEAEPENGAYLDSMGWVLFRLGRAEEALTYVQKSVDRGQGVGDETILDHLGDVLDKLGRQTEAVANWTKALQMARQAPYADSTFIQKVEQKLKARDQRGALPPINPRAP